MQKQMIQTFEVAFEKKMFKINLDSSGIHELIWHVDFLNINKTLLITKSGKKSNFRNLSYECSDKTTYFYWAFFIHAI